MMTMGSKMDNNKNFKEEKKQVSERPVKSPETMSYNRWNDRNSFEI